MVYANKPKNQQKVYANEQTVSNLCNAPSSDAELRKVGALGW